MIYPNCENNIGIEDYSDESVFRCEYCETQLRLDTDESSYTGASEKSLVIVDPDQTSDEMLQQAEDDMVSPPAHWIFAWAAKINAD